jgi:hypothetical protein
LATAREIAAVPQVKSSKIDELVVRTTEGILTRFEATPEERERLVAAWLEQQDQPSGNSKTRARIETHLARLKELDLAGDLESDEYCRRCADLLAERAVLPAEPVKRESVRRRLAGFLADLRAAWTVATPTGRNRPARQRFAEALVENRTAVAVKPRPERRPASCLSNGAKAEATGIAAARALRRWLCSHRKGAARPTSWAFAARPLSGRLSGRSPWSRKPPFAQEPATAPCARWRPSSG